MGEQGAALQKYNQELVKCIEAIKLKRNTLNSDISKEESVRNNLESEILQLKCKLDSVNSSLEKKYELRKNYDTAIKESEIAYIKILESSETLLNKVRHESKVLEDNQ